MNCNDCEMNNTCEGFEFRPHIPKYEDDPNLDATDGAHPAWWRGCDHGILKITQNYAELLPGLQLSGSLHENIEQFTEALQLLQQVSGILCEKCGWAMKFPDEPCRCELSQLCEDWKKATGFEHPDDLSLYLSRLTILQQDAIHSRVLGNLLQENAKLKKELEK